MLPEGLININGESVQVLQILFLTTMITLLPSLLVMMTSFAKYVISLSFLRTAMGTQQTPPNTVLVGLAIFLTLLTMQPVFSQIQTEALEPYQEEEIGEEVFLERAAVPLKRFMLDNTEPGTLALYCDLAGVDTPDGEAAVDLPLHIVVPSFMTSELKEAFLIGFLLYIPFVLIDIVVASTLMSMGMIMLPPAMISTPFKLLLFISVNGWELLFASLVQSVGLDCHSVPLDRMTIDTEAKKETQMDLTAVMDLVREAVGVALKLGGPMLVLSMLVGVVVAIFQAVTQIHEQSIGFMLKLIVVVLVLLIGGGWMLETLQDYAYQVFALIAA